MSGGKQRTIGSRAEVWHGTAMKTSGGLKKSQLMQNKHGRIVSRKKHATAKKENRLVKAGFGTKKGHFGYVTKDGSTSRKGSRRRKHRGGMNSSGSRGLSSNSQNYGSDTSNSGSGSNAQKMMMMKQHSSSNSSNGSHRGGGFGPNSNSNSNSNNSNYNNSNNSNNNSNNSGSMASKLIAAKMSDNNNNHNNNNNNNNNNSNSSRGSSRGGSRRRRMKGGMSSLTPSNYNGQGVETSGNQLQFLAGNAA
jgi:hypothetical protein